LQIDNVSRTRTIVRAVQRVALKLTFLKYSLQMLISETVVTSDHYGVPYGMTFSIVVVPRHIGRGGARVCRLQEN
jgi:hypothetical protein